MTMSDVINVSLTTRHPPKLNAPQASYTQPYAASEAVILLSNHIELAVISPPQSAPSPSVVLTAGTCSAPAVTPSAGAR